MKMVFFFSFKDNNLESWQSFTETDLPTRMKGNRLYRFSKVLESDLGEIHTKALPQCPHLVWANPIPLNQSAPGNLYQSQKLLSLMEETNVPLENFNTENTIKGESIKFYYSKICKSDQPMRLMILNNPNSFKMLNISKY